MDIMLSLCMYCCCYGSELFNHIVVFPQQLIHCLGPQQPKCKGFYNIMYCLDPIASRIEPLLTLEFSHIPPMSISSIYPCYWDQDNPTLLVNTMEAYPDLFMDVDCDQDQDSLISQKPLTSIESCDNMKPISNTDVSVSSAVFGPASSFDLENDEEFVASAELSSKFYCILSFFYKCNWNS